MEMTRRLLGLFLLLLHLLVSAHKTEGEDCHNSNQTRPSGHHPRPFGVTQKISNRLGQVIAGKQIVKKIPWASKLYSSQWAQRSWHWFSSSIFVPLGGKAGQRRHVKFVQRISVEFSLTETAKQDHFNSQLYGWQKYSFLIIWSQVIRFLWEFPEKPIISFIKRNQLRLKPAKIDFFIDDFQDLSTL